MSQVQVRTEVNTRVRILAEGDDTLHLKQAILLYQSDNGCRVYATTHCVDGDASQPHRKVIGAGAPLSKEGLALFARAADAATAYAGFVPDNLLYTAPNMLAWWTPSQVRTTWFKCQGEEIGEQAGLAAHPALVFVVFPHGWHVYALRESKRPGLATVLYHAPHFNVSDSGSICAGNVKLPNAINASTIPLYEDAFFRSHFTHPNNQAGVKYKGGMGALWRDQLRNPDPAAMQRALKSTKKSLQTTIAAIAAKR